MAILTVQLNPSADHEAIAVKISLIHNIFFQTIKGNF